MRLRAHGPRIVDTHHAPRTSRASTTDVVSALEQGNVSALYAGAVYVFTRNRGTWTQEAYIKASNTDPGDFFGLSVALSGDGATLAVGASEERSDATGINGNEASNDAPIAGAVYVFTRTQATWAQQAYVKASNTHASGAFGQSVALSADATTLAVGATGERSNATDIGGDQSDDTAPGAGAVYLH